MFYSHELLTNNEHGVATIWNISQGSTKVCNKITRKDIQGVKVADACDIFTSPEVPLALRLQGHLLYGVSCVYSRQCGYVLTDAVKVQTNLQTWQRTVANHDMDDRAKNTSQEQITLQDDPSFIIANQLPNLDQFLLGFPDKTSSQLTTFNHDFSQFSPQSKTSKSSQGSGVNLGVPHSPMGSLILSAPFDFQGSSAQKQSPNWGLPQNEEPFLEDNSARIGKDGEIIFADEELDLVATGALQGIDQEQLLLPREEAAQVRQPNQPGQPDLPRVQDDFQPPIIDEPQQPQPSQLLRSSPPPGAEAQQPAAAQQEPQSESSTVLASVRARRDKKPLPLDRENRIRMSVLREWSGDYVGIQKRARQSARHQTHWKKAQKNGFGFVFGVGVGLIGRQLLLGGQMHTHPLAKDFAGHALAKVVLDLPEEDEEPRGISRKTPDDEELEEGRRVRPRLEGPEEDIPAPIPGDIQEPDLPIMVPDESQLEVGREPASALSDQGSLPWNRGSSLPGTATKAPSIHSGQVRPPSSPLARRGSSIAEIERFSDNIIPSDIVQPSPERDFGPGASYPRNAAETSQGMRKALDIEGSNFLAYLERVAHDNGLPRDEDDSGSLWIEFEDILGAPDNTKIVASNAFLNVLALKTKNLIKVDQDGRGDMVPFGKIWIGLPLVRHHRGDTTDISSSPPIAKSAPGEKVVGVSGGETGLQGEREGEEHHGDGDVEMEDIDIDEQQEGGEADEGVDPMDVDNIDNNGKPAEGSIPGDDMDLESEDELSNLSSSMFDDI